jgi:uncharacterized protein
MTDRQSLPGKFIWFELVSSDPRPAQAFYSEVLGWKIEPFTVAGFTVDMIYVGDEMIGSLAEPPGADQPSRWIACVSIEDVDAAARLAAELGGRVLDQPADVPGAGRMARIADPQGAELYLFRKLTGDPPDGRPTRQGDWMWHELHTTDTASALAFYEKVVGFDHRALDMGPGGTYHVLSRGGVDRGGATSHLPPGAAPHWLPYVYVDDADATIARVGRNGGTVQFGPEDIPGIGRFGVLQDPSGARLAVMKPAPMEKRA